jgi:pimeloyl-ACP methyl ester carboxylesterase
VGAGHPHAADAAELRQGGAVRADDPLFTYGSHEPHGATWVLRGDRGVPGARHPIYTGWDEAVAEVEAAMRALPAPVDAIVGFSMGGNLAIEVAARAERGVSGLSPLRCIVTLEASYALNYDSQPGMSKELYATPLVTPVLLGLSAAGLPSTRNRAASHRDSNRPHTAMPLRHGRLHRPLSTEI